MNAGFYAAIEIIHVDFQNTVQTRQIDADAAVERSDATL